MSYMKKPCQHCPYRKDVKPFLTEARAEELAYLPQNQYNEFHCHKTLDHDDNGGTCVGSESQLCAGFLTMSACYNGEDSLPEGFEPAYGLCYEDPMDMISAYEDPEYHEAFKQEVEWLVKKGHVKL